jgi:hypothetical protein
MSQAANIVLTDAATTPVNHTFAYAGVIKGLKTWFDRSVSQLIGQPSLTLVQKPALTSKASTETSWKVRMPVLEVTSPSTATGLQPAPTISHVNSIEIKFSMHAKSANQERKDILAFARDLIDEAILTEQVVNYDITVG